MENTLNTLYKTLFPDRTLKPLQVQIIEYLINGHDTLAVLATGAGKSICYQLQYLYNNRKKSIIVVSPLIALMEDQHINLSKMGIPSLCFNSNMSHVDKEHNKMSIIDGDEHKILYMTPEYLVKEEIFVKDLVREKKLCLIAIDEAHCISTWGHDFRKEFQQLGCLKEWLTGSNIPIFACTATATPKVQKDILHFLQLDNPKIVKSSFDRTNLSIECYKKSSDIFTDIQPFLDQFFNDCIIIYAKTREDTEKICSIVQKLNITCEAYHGGMTPKARKDIHNGFVNGTYRCIVATVAFGMGIDQNVHLIIHYGVPNDMESYTQEIGRAGRDGVESKCVLFWSNKDLMICRILLKDNNDEKYRKFKEEQIKIMENWVQTNLCRKKIILKHFGEIMNNPCMKCDNCFNAEKEKKRKYDQGPLYFPMFIIMKTMFTINKRGIGINKIIDILRGSKSKAIQDLQTCPTFGLGFKYGIDFLKELIKLLVFNNLLKEVSLDRKFGSMIVTTESTIQWWNNARQYKSENEMNNILWTTLNIPPSFEIIINYLPRNNDPQSVFNRKTDFEKALDAFNMDINGKIIGLDNGIDDDNDDDNKIYNKKPLIQTMDISNIKKNVPKKNINNSEKELIDEPKKNQSNVAVISGYIDNDNTVNTLNPNPNPNPKKKVTKQRKHKLASTAPTIDVLPINVQLSLDS